MKKRLLFITIILLFFSLLGFSQDYYLPFQGKLYFDGNPVNGTRTFTFSINDGAVNWTNTYPGVEVNNGLYSVDLGPMPANIFENQSSRQLNILVDGNPIGTVTIYAPIENDPTVPDEIKDGVSWDDISNKPTVDQSNSNELQLLSLVGDTLFLSNGNFVVLSPASENIVAGSSLQVGGGDTLAEIAVEQPSVGSVANVTDVWQAFTPTIDGKLSKIYVYFGNPQNTNITLRIYQGDVNTQAIFNQNFPGGNFSSGAKLQVFDVAAYFDPDLDRLSANENYVFRLTATSNIQVTYNGFQSYKFGESSLGENDDLRFAIEFETISASSLIVESGGNVGIGTNDPTSKLTVNGRVEDKTGYLTPVGTINAFAGTDPPKGWLVCDGSAVRRDIYADLFAAIGENWGKGDDLTTFNLPDLRGYFLRGQDAGAMKDPDASKRKNSAGEEIGDKVGSYQEDRFRDHKHRYTTKNSYINRGSSGGQAAVWRGDANADSGNATNNPGDETRPKNASVLYIIKY